MFQKGKIKVEEKEPLLRDDSTDSSNTISDPGSASTGSTSAPGCSSESATGEHGVNTLAKKADEIAAGVVGIKALLEKRTWIKIGKVENLIYYPIDGGIGLPCHKVLCTVDGITDVSGEVDTDIYKDRCLVAYNVRNEAELKPEVAIIDKAFEKTINVLLEGKTNSRRHINYLGTDIPIKCDFGYNDIDKTFEEMFKHNTNVKIGYFSQKDRSSSLIERRRGKAQKGEKNNIEGFLGNHSHYTLVNSVSVNRLKDEFKGDLIKNALEGNSNISYKCFRPHIVIDGPPYCEDLVEYMRIGEVMFGNIIPCVHSNDVNYNRDDRLKPFSHLYGYLQKIRPLPIPDFNLSEPHSNFPKFGINMEKMIDPDKKEDGEIMKIGDEVWVTYRI